MFDAAVLEAIRQHAADEYPREACGLVISGEYFPCANRSTEPDQAFQIHGSEFGELSMRGTVQAVVHSHPDGPEYPTALDMRQQLATGVPWGITPVFDGVPAAPFWWGEGAPVAPLVGRGFRHGVTDCYSLIRDWYRLERGVALPEFPRDWEWWTSGEDLYRRGFRSAGFRPVPLSEARPGDVFLAQIRSPGPNHGGIYLGEGLALHHLTASRGYDPTRLSKREPIHRWQTYITHWLRHEA